MIFEWDQAKSARSVRERGLPFEVAIALFDGPTIEEEDQRQDYGEIRVRALGEVNGVVPVCVCTDRAGDARRIISLRVAKRRERDAHRTAYPR